MADPPPGQKPPSRTTSTPGAGRAGGGGGAFSLGNTIVNVPATAVSFGLGEALHIALAPYAEELRQESWSKQAVAALPPETVAALAAKFLQSYADADGKPTKAAYDEAKRSGVDAARLNQLAYLAATPPAPGELLQLLRRKLISFDPKHPHDGPFVLGLRENKMPANWHALVAELQHEHLSPEDVATAIQRGIVKDPGYLPVDAPRTGKVIHTKPLSDLGAEDEAAKSGISPERLAVLTRLVGLPPGPHELLDLLNRGKIGEADYKLGIAQGNLKNEWADALLNLKRALLSPTQYAEAHLRGWIGEGEMLDGAALSGMEDHDTKRLYDLLGRPLNIHEITTGLARGGTYHPQPDDKRGVYDAAVEESNVRPEYYDLAKANKYLYPSAFVLRFMIQQGILTAAEGEQTFLEIGWKPDLAKKAAHALAAGTATGPQKLTVSTWMSEYENGFITADTLRAHLQELGYTDNQIDQYVQLGEAKRVAATRAQRLGFIRTRYVGHKISRDAMTDALAQVAMTDEARTHLIDLWTAERELNQAVLTKGEVKKAWKDGIYSLAQTIGILEKMGYSEHDAYIYLEQQPPPGSA